MPRTKLEIPVDDLQMLANGAGQTAAEDITKKLSKTLPVLFRKAHAAGRSDKLSDVVSKHTKRAIAAMLKALGTELEEAVAPKPAVKKAKIIPAKRKAAPTKRAAPKKATTSKRRVI